MKLGLIGLVMLTSCVRPLSPQDVTLLHDVKRDSADIYVDAGAKTADGQMARAVFCAAEAIMVHASLDAYDPSNGAIVCKVKK